MDPAAASFSPGAPQTWNRYSYVLNNPLSAVDPDGEIIDTIVDVGFLIYDVADMVKTVANGEEVSGTQWAALGADFAGFVLPGATGGGAMVRAAAKADDLVDGVRALDRTLGGVDKVADVARVGDEAAQGGTYVLRDPATGEVMRTGRTKDLARRRGEHARDPALRDLDFKISSRTDVYSEQRGLEQLLHDAYQPPLNRINPIGARNPRLQEYLDAARRFLGIE